MLFLQKKANFGSFLGHPGVKPQPIWLKIGSKVYYAIFNWYIVLILIILETVRDQIAKTAIFG